MKQIITKWKGMCFLIMLLSVLCLAGGTKTVSAAEADGAIMCRVTFANAKGQTPEFYKKMGKTVEMGTMLELPKLSRDGYKYVWVAKINGKEYKYSAGAKVRITQNTKFCLNIYKLYKVSFYTSNGKKEYVSLRKSAYKGQTISLPSGSASSSVTNITWATSVNGKDRKKSGTKVKVTGNMKFYAVNTTSNSVVLCRQDGRAYRTVSNSNKTATFPSVDAGNGNMFLGWSKTKGKTSQPEYYAGDKIPTTTGNYYMVVFNKNMDHAPASLTTSTKFSKVYFVGDSRTNGMKTALGTNAPSNVEFIAENGMGLNWFQTEGFYQLYRDVRSQSKQTRKAVIINLGANDLKNSGSYTKYMKAVAKKLKPYNCRMYYLSVNPVNSAMIKNYMGYATKTEAQVKAFNKMIYSSLCTGKSKTYTYINTCTNLQKYGWISSRNNTDNFDGVHYSNETYLRIYNYCMKYLNR